MGPFFRALEQPEYVHTLINPLPIYGLLVAMIALLIGLVLRNRAVQMTGLILVLLTAASAWPAAHFGDEAYDRVLSMADQDSDAWLAAHAHRADTLVWLYYTLAAVALLAIIAARKFPKMATTLSIVTLLLAIVSLAGGAYIAYAGGKVRHREFRNEPPPPKPPERD